MPYFLVIRFCWVLIILLISVMSTENIALLAADPDPKSCPAVVDTITKHMKKSYDDFDDLVEGVYVPWASKKKDRDRAEQMSKGLSEIFERSGQERATVIEALLKRDDLSAFHKRVISLARYDLAEWQSLFQNPAFFLRKAGSDERLYHYGEPLMGILYPLLQHMPPTFADSVLSNSIKSYLKSHPKDDRSRRLISVLIRTRHPPQEFINQSMNAGKTAIEAYTDYLSMVRNLFSHPDIGHTGNEVLDAAKAIQSHLRKLSTRNPLRKGPLILRGSIPMGRGTRTGLSDLDFSYDARIRGIEASMHDFAEGLEHDPRLPKISGLNPFSFRSPQMALESPIQIEITADNLVLVAYPTPEWSQIGAHYQVRMGEPKRYVLPSP